MTHPLLPPLDAAAVELQEAHKRAKHLRNKGLLDPAAAGRIAALLAGVRAEVRRLGARPTDTDSRAERNKP